MGRRGPPQTPSRVLQLRGTFRKDRHGDPGTEPDFERVTKMPRPPGFFDAIARMEWRRVGPELIEKELLTVADMAAFTLYCLNVSRVVAAERLIAEEGMVVESFHGSKAHPAVLIARQCGAEVRKFAQEFGLTPSARTRVKATPKPKGGEEKPDDPWGKLAGGGAS
jgi:P27 family predicted phage terminase small subunit